MRIGIGTKEEAKSLGEMQCHVIVTTAEFVEAINSPISPLRPDDDDVIVVINPKNLAMDVIKRIAETGVPIEVAGYDPQVPKTYEERRKLRSLTPNVGDEVAPSRPGRPSIYEVAQAHIQDTIDDWHAGQYVEGKWKSKYTPAGVMERARLRTGLKELPDHWARNIMVSEFGSAVRNPHGLPKKGDK